MLCTVPLTRSSLSSVLIATLSNGKLVRRAPDPPDMALMPTFGSLVRSATRAMSIVSSSSLVLIPTDASTFSIFDGHAHASRPDGALLHVERPVADRNFADLQRAAVLRLVRIRRARPDQMGEVPALGVAFQTEDRARQPDFIEHQIAAAHEGQGVVVEAHVV